jgi:predicted DNA-binding ribbon-helix-helix protein
MDSQTICSDRSLIEKRSVIVCGHKTSVSLELLFWVSLKEIAHSMDVTHTYLLGRIETDRTHGNLSSAIRLFVLDHYKVLAEQGKIAA